MCEKQRTANTVLAIGRLNGFVSTEVQNSTSVLRTMDSAKKSPMKRSTKTNVHPSEIFKREVMDANGLSISMTADLLGVPQLKISNILNHKEDITPALAQKIALAFGGNADFWVRMQKGYNSMNKTL